MTLGEKLREARKSAGLSQQQLAEKLCVSRQAVTKWESDKGMPDIGNLRSISSLLNVSIDYLLAQEEQMNVTVIKEAICLDDFEKTKRCRCQHDAVVLSKYPSAVSIHRLMNSKKLTKVEFWLDLITLPGIFDIAYICKDRNQYYLVETESKQFFVSVSKEFIESREMSKKITEKKFVIGDIQFKKQRYDLIG